MTINKIYRTTYGSDLIGLFNTLEEAMDSIDNHPCFVKSKYTRKGRPRSGNKDLKVFYIVDNSGDMFYIY